MKRSKRPRYSSQAIATRGRPGMRATAWLAIFGILSLLFMPLGDGPAVVGAGDASVAPGDAAVAQGDTTVAQGSIEICTLDGLRQLRLGADGQPLPATPGGHKACPFCTAHPGFSLAAQVEPAVLPPVWPRPPVHQRVVAQAAPKPRYAACHRCRAPPSGIA